MRHGRRAREPTCLVEDSHEGVSIEKGMRALGQSVVEVVKCNSDVRDV